MKFVLVFIFYLSLNSCAYLRELGATNPSTKNSSLSTDNAKFELLDKAGSFTQSLETGLVKNDSSFASKYMVYSKEDKNQVLEKGVSVSKLGKLKKTQALRPSVSQYTVWFEGKKYFTQLKVLPETREIAVNLESPEAQWNKKYKVIIPKTSGIACFFNQLIECVGITGFLSQAIKNERGELNFQVIWEGYPYIGEQYLDMPDEVISEVVLSYDGKTDDGFFRFSLNFNKQNIFYVLSDKLKLMKKFWISQGYSLIRK